MVFEHFLTFLTKNNNFHFFAKNAIFFQGTSLKSQPPSIPDFNTVPINPPTGDRSLCRKNQKHASQQFKPMVFESFLTFWTKNKNVHFSKVFYLKISHSALCNNFNQKIQHASEKCKQMVFEHFLTFLTKNNNCHFSQKMHFFP